MTQLRECVDNAIRAVNHAWQNPDQAIQDLSEAEHLLHEALAHAQQVKDPARLQQVQDAKNAVEQALRSAENRNQDKTQVNNAIDQAARACKQIH